MPRGREIRRCLFARALKRIGVHSRLRGGFENGAVLVNHGTPALTSSSWRNCATPCATPVYTNFHRYFHQQPSLCRLANTGIFNLATMEPKQAVTIHHGFSRFPASTGLLFEMVFGLECSLPFPLSSPLPPPENQAEKPEFRVVSSS